jgi:hypothetical protein
MSSTDKWESEMEEMVRMNNNHLVQHIRHTHTHTQKGGGDQRMLLDVSIISLYPEPDHETGDREKKKEKKKEF